jgi:hypothetical protein
MPRVVGVVARAEISAQARPGRRPDLRLPLVGCSFVPGCKYAIPACGDAQPVSVALEHGGSACCIWTGQLGGSTAAATALA